MMPIYDDWRSVSTFKARGTALYKKAELLQMRAFKIIKFTIPKSRRWSELKSSHPNGQKNVFFFFLNSINIASLAFLTDLAVK